MNIRFLATSACSVALLLVAGCGDSGAKGDKAATSADQTQAFVSAADALSAELGKPGEKAQMPPPGDAAVKAFDEQTSKGLATLGTDALPIRGFDSFDDLCGKTAEIVQAYVSTGLDPSASQAEQQQLMLDNVNKHMDQIFSPLLFSAHCTAVHMPFIEKTITVDDLQSKADAVRQVRDGAYGQVSGLLEMAGDTSFDLDRRRRILDLLAKDAHEFAIVLSQSQRRQLADMARQVGSGLPADAREAKANAEKIATALRQAPCETLCQV